MASYSFEAVDVGGRKTRGMVDVSDQGEALRRIKQMGLFPTRIIEGRERALRSGARRPADRKGILAMSISVPIGGGVKPRTLAIFTRQLATLVEAGMPLLRGLRTLQEQEEHPVLKRVLGELSDTIESGSSLSEAMGAHPRLFNRLYLNMVKAGELGGALEITLRRLAEFMEKAQRIRGKIKAAMVYPAAVMTVAITILSVLMTCVVPGFQKVFDGLLEGKRMPTFTLIVLNTSRELRAHLPVAALALVGLIIGWILFIRTKRGRWTLDQCKLNFPLLGPVFRKDAISRFSRTLGTLLNSGVPILQALEIVRETAGNVVVGRVVAEVQNQVKEGETIAAPLKASKVFPAMVAGLVDVGEQTGSLPDMLMKIADNYDEDVENAVGAMMSLLEPLMIVFLAVVVGSIVIALFLPLVKIIEEGMEPNGGGD